MRRPTSDRDAKIEQLLLVGLDHYFAGPLRARHQRLDPRAVSRSQPSARARLHRPRAQRAGRAAARVRGAAAERRRGLPARRGDEARRLLQAAIDGGAPSEEALAVLDRLNRLETAAPPSGRRFDRRRAGATLSSAVARRSPVWRAVARRGGAVHRCSRRRVRGRRGAASTSDRSSVSRSVAGAHWSVRARRNRRRRRRSRARSRCRCRAAAK